MQADELTNIKNLTNVTIYWDASLSQENRNKDKDYEFLNAFFKEFPNTSANVVVFNSEVVNNKKFTITSGNWKTIKSLLDTTICDGASNYSTINTDITDDYILLFSDGKANFGTITPSLYSPRIISVSSMKNINKKFLYELAFYNRGYYIDVLKDDISASIEAIVKNKTLPKLRFVVNLDDKKNYIRGTVSDKNGPLSNVTIKVLEKDYTTVTLEDGSYIIEADPGDVVSYSSISKKTVKVELDDYKVVDIQMQESFNELETVFIKADDEDEGEEKVLIGDRMVNKRQLGYDVQSISEEEISDDEFTLGQAMAGKFTGVQMGNNNNAGQMLIRGGFGSFIQTNHPLFIIDGTPLKRSGVGLREKQDMSFINPNNIANITVLKGLAATNRYGSQGSSGVVLITTKTGSAKYTPKEEKKEAPEIKYKVYTKSLVVDKIVPEYKEMLRSFSDIKKAYNQYLAQRKNNLNNVTYFIESADYFFESGDKEKGTRILSNIAELFSNNASVLKILVFHLEKYDLHDEAQHIYNRIINLVPSFSQTHFDLAKNYHCDEKFQESIDLYNKIVRNKVRDIPAFNGLNSQISNDFKLLLSERKQGWKLKNIPDNFFNLPQYDLRVVVEWSHPQTEFELQYINPKKQYFTLSHTKEKNKNTLQHESVEGFTSEEFLLKNTEKGKWFLNLILPDDYEHNIKSPKFVRVKVYSNFGKITQKLTTHVLNLDRIFKNSVFTDFKI